MSLLQAPSNKCAIKILGLPQIEPLLKFTDATQYEKMDTNTLR